MRRKIESFVYGRRWRADERAWHVWQNLAPLVPASFVDLDSRQPVVGRVQRVYQQARRGTKAVVHFGSAMGLQDTWWEEMRPPVNQWVVVRTHLWLPPGTHSGQHVVWVDKWEGRAPGDVYARAVRHERRLEKEGLHTSPTDQGEAIDSVVTWNVPRGQPLFHRTAFAAAADVDEAILAAVDIAAELTAKTYGPSEVGGGKLLSIWPPSEIPTFVSVTARAISAETVWVGIAAQSLAVSSLDIADEVSAALESRLGNLGPEVRPPPRELEYDRETTRRLESEIQELLEALATDSAPWGHTSNAIYERELLLQRLTGLGA